MAAYFEAWTDFSFRIINLGTFIFHVRLTDDVMSDCVGGDYVIDKNWKKRWNLWGDFQKGDETWYFLKALKWIFRVPPVPDFDLKALHSPYENLEGFKVDHLQKNEIFLRSFLP